MGRIVEEVSASLVREYLSRKGLKKTIACMDEEFPRSTFSINSREDLRRVLHLESLYKKNKVQEFPYKTLLELVVWSRTEESSSVKGKPQSGDTQPARANRLNSIGPLSAVPNESAGGTNVCAARFVQQKTNVIRSPENDSIISPPNGLSLQSKSTEALSTPLNSLAEKHSSERLPLPRGGDTFSSLASTNQAAERRSLASESQRSRHSRLQRGMMTGPVTSTLLDGSKKRVTRKPTSSTLLLPKDEEPKDKAGSATQRTLTESSRSSSLKDSLLPPGFWEDVEDQPSEGLRSTKDSSGLEGFQRLKPHAQLPEVSPTVADVHMELSMTLDDIDDEEAEQSGLARPTINPNLPRQPFDLRPVDLPTATALKEILLGSPVSCFGEEWKCQSFTFSDKSPLTYGIVQKKGGPCGVLASVQACVLLELLFEHTDGDSPLEQLVPTSTTRTQCLALAISNILWRAGGGSRAVVAVSSQRPHFTPVGRYKSDGVLEKITCCAIDSFEKLKLFVEQHITQFERGPFGCILLTISAILSRSIEGVRSDMDVPTTTLIGAHGYCTQELVNLLLCGRAVSNVFNNEMRLESGNGIFTLLRGISSRSDIGLLSLFEHYNICKVGDFLKHPRYPIWVVCSESHFSVLFSLNKNLASDCFDEAATFDLYYYDGLANQQDQIRLTVCAGLSSAAPVATSLDSDLIPPLEHCIRTRWRDAVVDWNDTEPIL